MTEPSCGGSDVTARHSVQQGQAVDGPIRMDFAIDHGLRNTKKAHDANGESEGVLFCDRLFRLYAKRDGEPVLLRSMHEDLEINLYAWLR